MKRVSFLAVFFALSLVVSFGCGGKKTVAKKDYGKPTWLTLDKSKFSKLSDYETNLEGGTVTVFDPDGWERMPPGAAKPPQGFKSVIVFKKDGATMMMTKSRTAKDMPDLDEENVEEFAESAQQLFRAPVRMLKLGDIVGVMFSKQVADKNRLSKRYNRRIVATSINGQLFTYELVSDDNISDAMLGALYAVISKTKIEGVGVPTNEPVAATTPEEEPKDEPATTAKPEEAPAEQIADAPTPVEPQTETKPVELVVPKPEPARPVPTPRPAADRKNTKAILDELDALLN